MTDYQAEYEALAALQQEARERIEQAVAFAEASPEPDVSTIMEGVYA